VVEILRPEWRPAKKYCYKELADVMPLQKEIKTQLIEEYQKHPTDTGSTEVQISILTTRIKQLTEHLKINKHDESSRRGLLIMVGRRRRLMNYLRRKDYVKYLDLVQKLQLRKLK
jgi:small subunit ribosomal protein S15